jgi:hypothetical protein
MAPIAIAADERLGTTVWTGAQEQPGLRQTILVATAAAVMRSPMAWTRAVATAMMPLQSCLCTVCGTAPKQNCQVMDRCRACQSWQVLAHQHRMSRGQAFLGPAPRDCPGGSTGTSRPRRVAARTGRSATRAGGACGLPGQPAAPKRSSAVKQTSAKNYGFGAAFTCRQRP